MVLSVCFFRTKRLLRCLARGLDKPPVADKIKTENNMLKPKNTPQSHRAVTGWFSVKPKNSGGVVE
ncbi:MAG: hypothetical protein A3H01_02390 [Candidatus Wildermuthbacteria bacterium RIFCSPLOWO2_12_FULL_40_9]|uniref:Uncharacterized protein n=1 Tax=Candidatus Wildermuthbacteria bacterium RIFCSPLOWO2_12_FULL_40_9 TaxID=1802467 RepID=A0A1G2RX98_9BACT|nr:MAG: hypothetical protein A3H01_02390 [Candidatus Wildermuthbacteria bacterium RIFCSPLOWO2_12_FULL_40_9]